MRIPLSWIREHTEFPADGTPEQLMAELVRVGLEEEDVHRPTAELSGPIVVGEVLEKNLQPQKNGRTINWCQVRVVPEGQQQSLTGEGISPDGVQGVICGADNFEVGDKVVVTLPGAVLPGDFRIFARKTYGHLSAGMIASVRELGIGEDHDGILVLGTLGLDAEPGADALELLGLYDSAAEISVTPDRGYAFSIRGVAREYAHATSTAFTDPAQLVELPGSTVPGHEVVLDDHAPIHGTQGCDTFVARTVTGIDPEAPTPAWMTARLRLAGMRPISLAVDISNYVMWELGQPLHCYDAATLEGAITVRRASPGETLVTLDDKERELDPEDLLITDDAGPIGIAGVMGGARTEVSATTTTVVIEAAHFDPITVGRSRRRHKLPSEASRRNERGVDPLLPRVAAQRAADLLIELAGGTDSADGAEVTEVGTPILPAPVVLDLELPARVTGVEYAPWQIIDTLRQIGAEVEGTDGGRLKVVPPSWRPDMTIPEALVEEIARLVGYDQIPSRLPVAPAGRGLTAGQRRRRQVLSGLAGAGMTEVLSYPFLSAEANTLFGRAEPDQQSSGQAWPMVRLANPIASQHSTLRTTVLPGLLDILGRNVSRGFSDLALFEAGLVFLPHRDRQGTDQVPGLGAHPGDVAIAELDAGLPHQPWHLAAAFCGAEPQEASGRAGRSRDWADAVEAAQNVAQLLGVDLEVSQGEHQALHPGRTAQLRVDGAVIGCAGEVHPAVLDAWNLPERTAVMEVDLSVLLDAAPEKITAQPIHTFPLTTQDVSLIVDGALPAGELRATLIEGAGELLESVELFDVYDGEGIRQGRKSLAYAMGFRAPDRTLTAEEASAARDAAVQLAAERHSAVQR